MVKHLTFGGAVFLRNGIRHGVWAHEQRVPVVRAEKQRQNGEVRPRLNERSIFSDAKPLKNKLITCPSSPQSLLLLPTYLAWAKSPGPGDVSNEDTIPDIQQALTLCQGLSTLLILVHLILTTPRK